MLRSCQDLVPVCSNDGFGLLGPQLLCVFGMAVLIYLKIL